VLGSLFDYAKDMGKRLFTSDAEAGINILKHIEANNPGVNPVNAKYDNGCVTLSGFADSQAAREKCILMAGNVKGVEKVVADKLEIRLAQATPDAVEAPVTPEPEVETRFYTIQSGDTLYAIAKEFYGNGMKYPDIFEANREVILDADKIYPGQKIRIPSLS
jgi:nucleoid-associated protein YgaU